MKNVFLIVNYNDYKSTKHLVDNIIDFKCLDEIVIVDNNSHEEEKKKISSIKHKKIKIIYNDGNYGYSKAINIGAQYLIKKYKKCNLIISNSDIVIMCESDLIKLLDLLNYESIGLVGPQILELGRISRGMKNISPLKDVLLNMPLVKNIINDSLYLYKDEYYEQDMSVVDVISSCFFLISSENFKKINFMDENVFLYYEDFILSKKIRDLDLMVVVSNEVKIKHLYSISVNKVIKDIDKYKLLKKSQFYYHTTYNKTNKMERISLRISAYIETIFCYMDSFFNKLKK